MVPGNSPKFQPYVRLGEPFGNEASVKLMALPKHLPKGGKLNKAVGAGIKIAANELVAPQLGVLAVNIITTLPVDTSPADG